MSMAIKYAMMKHGKKMAGGGMCEHGSSNCNMCHGGEYAKGGEAQGVNRGHMPEKPGESMAGTMTRAAHRASKWGEDKEANGYREDAKKEHRKTLSELRSMKKPHLYAEGGDVDELREGSDDRMIRQDSDDMEHAPMPKDYESHEAEYAAENQEFPEEEEDMVGRIMKGRAQHMSKGGRVANRTDDYTDEEPNQFDDLVKDDDLEEHYTGANSGDEIGDHQEDEDRHDIVARIMKSRRLKDRNPRPA